MDIFLIVFIVMMMLVIAMSVGVILGRKPISGSCGGMSALGMEVACDVCKGDKTKCDKETAGSETGQNINAYDASR
jgi:hypothetical protein